MSTIIDLTNVDNGATSMATINTNFDTLNTDKIEGTGTANELAYFTAEKTIDNLAVSTYPSLTEVSYVKGVTSAIQTQLGDKEATTNKENTTLDTSTTKYPTNRLTKEYADGKVEDSITDGHTTIAPSGNAVFDALALKAPLISPSFTTPTIGGVAIPSISSTSTLTNKRNQPRVYSTTSVSTLTPEVASYNIFTLTAQASALTIANHSTSTPANGEMLLIEAVCDGTARALNFGTNYVAKAGTALPTTLVASKRTTLLFVWCSDISKYNLLTVGQEA